jgi:RHS repeat-associated protein
VTNAANETEHYTYDDKHVIQSRVMAGGATFYWAWQNEGKQARCLRQWANFPQLDSQYQWNDEENSVTIIHQDGSKSYYKHNTHGKLIQKISAAGHVQSYEYNDKGQLTAEIDGEGHITYYDYSPITGALDTITYPDGHSVHYDYLHGEIYTLTQGDKETYQQWRFRRDSQGNLLELIDPQERSTVYQYNAQGKPIFIQYPDQSHQRLVWSEQGELLEDNSSIQGLRQFGYDAIGRLEWEKQQNGSTTHYRYDALNRITQIILPNNTTREYRYNAYGKVIWFKDEMGKITQYDYAAPLHLLTQLHQPNGEKLAFQYDNGHLQISQITNQKGEHYQFRYTADGLLSEEIGFDNIKTTYHYNKNNQLIARCEYGDEHQSEPFITRYERDSLGRLIQKILPDGNIEHYEYDTIGRLIAVKDNENVLGWEYNKSNQLIAEHQNWATIRHRYDENTGLLNGTKLPDGQWLEYHYNQGQLLGMTLDHQPLAAFRWDKQGRECERRQGNGLVNRYQYDPLGQLIAHQRYHGYDISTQTSPTPIWQQQYHYNPNGQLAEITGHQPRRYRYDNADQLHTVTYPEVNPEQHHAEKVEQFDYDPTGNKISETQALAPTPFHANIAKGNRLTFFSDKHFDYDRFGNLIAEKRGKNHSLVTHYEYDCRHRLIKVIKPTGIIITYTYDAFNRRTSKTVDGKTTEFIWQGSKLIAETDNDKHWQSYLYELDSYRPLALVHGNAQQDNIKLYWYQNDHLGTPIALTSNMGDTLYECQYNAYGQIINETYHQDDTQACPDNPLRFQGQYYDEETGLHYNLNRYYDPFTGRYITQDPLGILGGLNSYQYSGSDPINWIDPLGLIKVENNGFEGVAGASKSAGNQTISNDILNNPRVGYGEKGTGSGNKIDQIPNKPVLDVDGKQITVYSGKPKPVAVQEFPPTAKSHGFNDIIDNYAGQATKINLNKGATLYQLEGSLNGVSGRFEWIVDLKLGGVSHRMFVPNGKINGKPSKP